MQRMAPDYDHLPLMKKVEVFEHSLELTDGDDLAKLLLLKSPSSEDWFDRRTNFTRSLAVMSMVGYVLGLGDRHPSNLLLDRMSGKILHIGNVKLFVNLTFILYARWRFKIVYLQTKLASLVLTFVDFLNFNFQ